MTDAPTSTSATSEAAGGPDPGVRALLDQAAALPGPDWLVRRRAEAATSAAAIALPTPQAEEWRYSRIAEMPLGDFAVVPDGSPHEDVPLPVATVLADLGGAAGHVVSVDGAVVAADLGEQAQATGVAFGPASEADALGSVIGEAHDAFAAWNDALALTPLVIDVPAGVELEAPLVVVHHIGAAGSASFPRLVVRAGEAASVVVVEVHLSEDVRALSAPVTEIAVGPAARVRHAVIQDLGARVWQVGSLVAAVDSQGTFSSSVAALGGDYARLRIDCRLVGRGATGNVASAYLGDGERMVDLRTFQDHVAPDTTSDLYFKGAVRDHAQSVYTGLIRILPGARGSNAVQANRVVKLSEHAWAESVPNLEIENNDVRCAHASTVGPVDEDQRFYLEARGVPPRAAERLIVGGFFADALEHFSVPPAADVVSERLQARLDRGLAGEASR